MDRERERRVRIRYKHTHTHEMVSAQWNARIHATVEECERQSLERWDASSHSKYVDHTRSTARVNWRQKLIELGVEKPRRSTTTTPFSVSVGSMGGGRRGNRLVLRV